jgi:hypothetical protein
MKTANNFFFSLFSLPFFFLRGGREGGGGGGGGVRISLSIYDFSIEQESNRGVHSTMA